MNTKKLIQMLRIAKKYYEYHKDQKTIAKEEDISVSTVSRMLQKAMDSGYIQVTIDYPQLSNEELSSELMAAYHIKKINLTPVIIPDRHAVLLDTCKAAAAHLEEYVKSDSIIGTAWGNTMQCLSECIPDLHVRNTQIVQLNGRCAGFAMPAGADDMVEALVKQAQGDGYIIPAPAIVDNEETAELLKKDTTIRLALTLARNCNTVIFSVGQLSRDSIMYHSGYLRDGVYEQLEKDGSVGDIASSYFDINGKPSDKDLAKRRLGITLEEFRSIPNKICIASGTEKAAALHGALRGGYIDVLYADEELGKALLAFL